MAKPLTAMPTAITGPHGTTSALVVPARSSTAWRESPLARARDAMRLDRAAATAAPPTHPVTIAVATTGVSPRSRSAKATTYATKGCWSAPARSATPP